MPLIFCLYCLVDTSHHLVKEFPNAKSLLNNAIARSLGVSDLSQFIQYSCTENAGVKVRAKVSVRRHYYALRICDSFRGAEFCVVTLP